MGLEPLLPSYASQVPCSFDTVASPGRSNVDADALLSPAGIW